MNDKQLIAHLGGLSAIAKRLGYPVRGGSQRVQTWITRGTPPA